MTHFMLLLSWTIFATASPLVGKIEVQRFVLPNGLKVLVVEDHSSPTFAYQTWFHVGSKNEKKGRTGLAHLFEHMMFKETKTYKDGEFDRILEGAGAEGENAFTSRDYTVYVQEMPSSQLDLIARMEADRMVNLVVNDKAFKTETAVVQNERRFRTENSPEGTMYQEIFDLAFKTHPYHWPVIGYQKDLDAMSSSDAMKFYKTYYAPNHATVLVTGDVTLSQVKQVIEKYYGALKAQPEPPRPVPNEPPQTSPRRKQMQLNIQVPKMMMGYRVPGISDADRAALDVVQGVLTGGKSARLPTALVNAGIATEVDSFDLEDEHPSLFVIAANLQKGKSIAQAENVILKEIDTLVKNGPTADELDRVKSKIEMQFYEKLSANADRANFLGHYETGAGNYAEGLKRHEMIAAVTPEQVVAAAKKYLKPTSRSVVAGVPK